MDDRNQYNNEGTPVSSGYEHHMYTPPPRRPKPWGRLALFMIVLGVFLFAVGWISGSRGGRVYFDRGIRVVSIPQEAQGQAMDMNFSNRVNSISVNTISDGIVFIPTSDAAPRITYSDNSRVSINEADGRLEINVRAVNSINIVGGNVTRSTRWQFMGFGRQGVSWNRANNTRFLDFDFDFANFSFSNISGAIRIYVPSTVHTIEARTTSGSIRMDDIDTSLLNLRSTSGRVTVEGGTHENSHLQSTSGSVNGDATFAGDLYARSTSGSVNIQDNSTSHRHVAGSSGIQLRSTSGSVNFSTRAPVSDFRYSLSSTSGSMRVDGSRLSGRSNSGGSGAVPINASSTSGSVRLDFGR